MYIYQRKLGTSSTLKPKHCTPEGRGNELKTSEGTKDVAATCSINTASQGYTETVLQSTAT